MHILYPFIRSFKFHIRFKHTIDYSLVPKIKEHELKERFVTGSGPGGSAVNKNANCVVLTHKPTGVTVKCHISRSLDDNRKFARENLIEKLDNLQNGEKSVNAQRKTHLEKKSKNMEKKRLKHENLKLAWKEREGLT